MFEQRDKVEDVLQSKDLSEITADLVKDINACFGSITANEVAIGSFRSRIQFEGTESRIVLSIKAELVTEESEDEFES